MKKLTAMLLALCMLLAVAPALGEDFSGSWYWVLEDVTIGTFELNADGTAAIHLDSGDSAQEMSGTWEVNGENGVTVTVDGQGLELVYDVEAGTLTTSLVPIPMQREKGKYDMALIAAVMQGKEVELPEGVTETELTIVAATFLTKMMALSASTTATGTDDGGSTGTPDAAAGSGVDILAENFVITESYSGFDGTYIAKVQNNTGSPLWLTDGTLQVKDASGNVVAEKGYLSSCASKYLEPGEISVVTIQVDLEQDGEYTYEKTIKAEAKSYYRTDSAVTVGEPEYTDGSYDSKLVKAMVTNDTDKNLVSLNVAFLLSDENGLPVALSTEVLYNHELCPNSSIVMVSSLYNRLVSYLAAKNITPAVEVFAWVENDK